MGGLLVDTYGYHIALGSCVYLESDVAARFQSRPGWHGCVRLKDLLIFFLALGAGDGWRHPTAALGCKVIHLVALVATLAVSRAQLPLLQVVSPATVPALSSPPSVRVTFLMLGLFLVSVNSTHSGAGVALLDHLHLGGHALSCVAYLICF